MTCLRQAILEKLDGGLFVRMERIVLYLTDSFSLISLKEIVPRPAINSNFWWWGYVAAHGFGSAG